jgi:hypothetical protein
MMKMKACRSYSALSAILLMISCGKQHTSYVVKGEFRYYNLLTETVDIYIKDGYNGVVDSYEVKPNDSLVLFTSGESDRTVAEAKGYRPAISGDTTRLIFNDSLCYEEHHFEGQVIQNIASYNSLKRGDRDYLFFFNIDSSLLKLAAKCP